MFIGLCLAMAASQDQVSATQLTVYNQGFGLVKETRSLQLRQGRQQVAIEDVAQRIEPSSVGIRSVSAPGSFEVLEQNYQYDLISTQAILNKAVGGRIVLNRVLPNGQRERIEGILLSSPSSIIGTPEGGPRYQYNGMVVRTDDGRILLDPSGEIEVSSIPEGLISRPTLLWDLEAEKGGSNTVELSYITQGISWAADYVLTLEATGKSGDLKGWVTINNNAGATFRDARLKLLAGDVQRNAGNGGATGAPMEMMRKADTGFQEEQFSEYHLYTLQRPATVRNNEMKQLSLLEATGVSVTKRLLFDAMEQFGQYRPGEGAIGTGALKPVVKLEIENSKANNLGMPLPMGQFKVYQRDNSGAVQLLGEDRIAHTPRDEKLSLVMGKAFDIVGERKRTQFSWLRTAGGAINGARETFEIQVRNRKDTPETIDVMERHYGVFKIIDSNYKFTLADSNSALFVVPVKANDQATLKYTVETYW